MRRDGVRAGATCRLPRSRRAGGDIPALPKRLGIDVAGRFSEADALLGIDGLGPDLTLGHKLIAFLADPKNGSGHAVVVTGIDTAAKVVHLNDSGNTAGGDEQVSFDTFEKLWAAMENAGIRIP
jgi:hypothetical protein